MVALFGIVIAYIDGFWLTALQGAIGAIERLESPFGRWLRQSTLLLPLIGLAVVVALLLAQRWSRRGRVGSFVAAIVMLTLVSAAAGVAAAIGSSIYDYSFQSKHLELMHSYGVAGTPTAVALAGFGPSAPLSYTLYCNLRGVAADSAVALMEYATLMTHLRALGYFSVVLLATNLVLAAGLLALYSNRLWVAPTAVDSGGHPATTGVAI
jgi:hypothetical protein